MAGSDGFRSGITGAALSSLEEGWAALLEEAPDTYYLTDYYRSYPLVLVRLSRVGADALRDLLKVSWRITIAKAPKKRRAFVNR